MIHQPPMQSDALVEPGNQVGPCEIICETKWDQVRQSETMWNQVRPSETMRDQVRETPPPSPPPPKPHIQLLALWWTYIYIYTEPLGISQMHLGCTQGDQTVPNGPKESKDQWEPLRTFRSSVLGWAGWTHEDEWDVAGPRWVVLGWAVGPRNPKVVV